VFDSVLVVSSFEMDESTRETSELSDEELQQIKQLSQDTNLLKTLSNSIAPTIFGMETIKLALVLQLVGGVRKEIEGNTLRGDIHVLLVGDPSVGKSQLLRFVADLLPRGIFAAGQSSSKAGLTAAAVKDDFGEGRWTLEAGALALADQGIACIDELDKMRPEDRSSMHEALEQQKININKAGISAELSARCAVLAAANPRTGRFDSYRGIAEEINLPHPLLTRFDVIFPIRDKPERTWDTNLGKHIVSTHCEGELKAFDRIKGETEDENMLRYEPNRPERPSLEKQRISQELLMRYIAYARNNISPLLSPEAKKYLIASYPRIRSEIGPEEENKVPITSRTLEAFIRLAEASAKTRLSPVVEIHDVELAIQIVQSSIENLTSGSGFDMDALEIGLTSSQQRIISEIRKNIEELCQKDPSQGAALQDILAKCRDRGISADEANPALDTMKEKRLIFQRKNGAYDVVRS